MRIASKSIRFGSFHAGFAGHQCRSDLLQVGSFLLLIHCGLWWQLHRQDRRPLTSLAMVSLDGAYRRYELDRPYFRQQQATHAEVLDQAVASDAKVAFAPDAAYWQTFLAILALFRQHDVRVIVNEILEAPYVCRHAAAKRTEREFLRREVRREVDAHGFTWVSPDTTVLRDEDYFDYNHLNSQGVARYSRLVADALRPHVRDDQ